MRWSEILTEASSPTIANEAYGISLWRRWWANTSTGQILAVDHGDHDEFFFNHIDDFLDVHDLARLPDPDSHEGSDACLLAAYEAGWCAIVYDGNNQHLGMRSEHPVALAQLRKLLATITKDLVVAGAELDLADDYHDLDAEQFARFIKFGRI